MLQGFWEDRIELLVVSQLATSGSVGLVYVWSSAPRLTTTTFFVSYLLKYFLTDLCSSNIERVS